MSSTGSQESQPTQTQLDHEALREAGTRFAGVTRLMRMVGVQTTHRNLATEDAAVERDIEAQQRILHGKRGNVNKKQESEQMRDVLAAGDVTVNYGAGQQKQTGQNGVNNKLLTAALVAGLLGPPVAAALTYWMTRPAQQSDETQWQLGLIPYEDEKKAE